MLLTLLPKDKINIYHGKGEYFTPKISASASQKSDRFFFHYQNRLLCSTYIKYFYQNRF